jgi:hypothetical protein
VSFNYDTIAERLARRLGKNVKPAPQDEVVVANAITLAKPHGSTSWSMQCHGALDRSAVDGGPRYDSLTLSDYEQKRSPLVLGAVPIKSELIREVQQKAGRADIFETVARQWRQVVRAVEFADEIVVAGYSFPRQDEYGRFIIREGLRARSQSKRPNLRIRFFETKQNEARSAASIQDLFSGHLAELIPAGPVVPPGGHIGDSTR